MTRKRRKFAPATWLAAFGFLVVWSPAGLAFSPDPEAYELNLSKGILAFGNEQYEQAEHLFTAALAARPGDPEASNYLGQTLIRLKKYEAGERVFRALLEVDPASGQALLGLGVIQYNQARYTEALSNLTAAQKSLPDDPLVHFYQGLAYHALEDFDKSPGRFLRAVTLSRDLAPSAHYYSGLAFFRRGILEEARAAFEEVLATGEPESELARSARELLGQITAALPVQRPKRWDLIFNAALQYDTNVVLLPLGTQPPGGTTGISRKDDYRHSLFARGEYRPIQTETWLGGIGYGIYQSFHSMLSTFDVEDHTPMVFLQRQLGPLQARLQYVFDYVKVGQSPYLISHAIQPVFILSEGSHAYTQLQFRYQHKDFQHGLFLQNSLRDGKNWLAGVTQYLLFANNAGSVRIGATFDMDRTGGGAPATATPGVQTNADWAYHGYLLSTGLSLPPLWSFKVDVAFDYYHQQYVNPNSFSPTGTVRRRDDIYFFTGTVTHDITQSLSLALQYSYTRDQNTISVFDYTRSIYSVVLAGRF